MAQAEASSCGLAHFSRRWRSRISHPSGESCNRTVVHEIERELVQNCDALCRSRRRHTALSRDSRIGHATKPQRETPQRRWLALACSWPRLSGWLLERAQSASARVRRPASTPRTRDTLHREGTQANRCDRCRRFARGCCCAINDSKDPTIMLVVGSDAAARSRADLPDRGAPLRRRWCRYRWREDSRAPAPGRRPTWL